MKSVPPTGRIPKDAERGPGMVPGVHDEGDASSGRVQLCCPECGSTRLGTMEVLSGTAYGAAFLDDNGTRDFDHEGWADVWWDVSETCGVECRNCHWACDSADYLSELGVCARDAEK